MAYKNKIRSMVALDVETDEKVEKLASMMRISKSKTIEYLVSNSIDMYSQMWSAMQNPNVLEMLAKLSSSIGDTDTIQNLKDFKNGLDNPDNQSIIDELNKNFTDKK